MENNPKKRIKTENKTDILPSSIFITLKGPNVYNIYKFNYRMKLQVHKWKFQSLQLLHNQKNY